MPRDAEPNADALGDDRLIDADAVAHALGLSRRSVYNLVERGELPIYRIGVAVGIRFRVGDVRAYVRAHQEPPAAPARAAAV